MRIEPTKPVRIQPDRRWFGNTRVITQTRLEQFRESMEKARKDPYSVVLKRSKLPVSLFSPDGSNSLSRKVGDMKERMPRVDLLSLEPFAKTFGRKQLRKKPKFQHEDLSDLAADVSQLIIYTWYAPSERTLDSVVYPSFWNDRYVMIPVVSLQADQKQSTYIESSDGSAVRDMMDPRDSVREEIYKKGTSRRIWQVCCYLKLFSQLMWWTLIDYQKCVHSSPNEVSKWKKKVAWSFENHGMFSVDGHGWMGGFNRGPCWGSSCRVASTGTSTYGWFLFS